MKIGFIGAGKVGFSLGKYFAENNIQLTGYYNRHIESAKEAAKFTNSNYYNSIEELVKDSDSIFITVSDGAINSVYEQLKHLDIKGKNICHCSGSLTVDDTFPEIEKYNAFGYSIHPLFPISDKYETYKRLQDAFFCIEGCEERISVFEEFLKAQGLKVRVISGENKVKYHAACAISSNLYCALVKESIDLFKSCGFENEEAICALKPLIIANTNSIVEKGPVNSLTGPMERADLETISKHIKCFDSELEKEMYLGVSRKLLQVAKEKHKDRDYSDIENILI